MAKRYMRFICTDCGCEVKPPPKGQHGITCGCKVVVRRAGKTHAARA